MQSDRLMTAIQDLRVEYEQAVQAIAHETSVMRQARMAPESIARWAHAERQRIAEAYKSLTPEPLRSKLLKRTSDTYGQTSGPSIEYLRGKGKSWEQIADSAARPGPISL